MSETDNNDLMDQAVIQRLAEGLGPKNQDFVNFHARSYLFRSEGNKEISVGLKFNFPLTPELNDALTNTGLTLPAQIDSIEILILSLDESLPPRKSINESPKPSASYPSGKRWTFYEPAGEQFTEYPPAKHPLNKLFASVYHPTDDYPLPWQARVARGRPEVMDLADTISSLIRGITAETSGGTVQLSRSNHSPLSENDGHTLLIMYGHGGSKHSPGKHYLVERTDSTLDSPHQATHPDEYSQSTRNTIHTEKLVEAHDNETEYAAILVCACNMENADLPPSSVPAFYLHGPYQENATPHPSKLKVTAKKTSSPSVNRAPHQIILAMSDMAAA